VCASLKLQYWPQLKYFVIELFGRVAAYAASPRADTPIQVLRKQNALQAESVNNVFFCQ
jgi:hypothetical protein